MPAVVHLEFSHFANFSSLRFKVVIRVGGAEEGAQVEMSIILPHILRKALLYCVFWEIRGMSQIEKTLQTCHVLGKSGISSIR